MQELEFNNNWYLDLCRLGFVNVLNKLYDYDNEIAESNYSIDEIKLRWFVAYLYVKLGKSATTPLKSMIKKIENNIYKIEKNQMPKIKKDILKMEKEKQNNKKLDKLNKKIAKLDEEKRKLSEEKQKLDKLNDKTLDDLKKDFRVIEPDNEVDEECVRKIVDSAYLFYEKQIKNARASPETAELYKQSEEKDKENKKNKPIKKDNKKKKLNKEINEQKLPISDTFLRNYGPFNATNKVKQVRSFVDILNNKISEENGLDKTINKFMESYNKAKNLYYCRINPNLIGESELLGCFLMSISYAFNYVNGRNICFYSNNFDFTKKVDEKIRISTDYKTENKLWSSLIDSLQEQKAEWSMNDLQFIEYKEIKNQKFIELNYIPISWQNAIILSNDKLRGELIKYKLRKKDKQESLIWQLLRNDSLMENCIDAIQNYKSSIHSSLITLIVALEQSLSQIDRTSNAFKNRLEDKLTLMDLPKNILDKRKEFIRNSKKFEEITNGIQIIKKGATARRLINLIKLNRKTQFINEIMNILLKSKNLNERSELFKDYISPNIINAEIWRSSALGLISNVI